MAFNPRRLRVTYSVQDNTAKERAWPVALNPTHPDCTDLATVASAPGITNLTAAAAKMEAVTLGKITKFTVSQEYVSDAAGNGAGDNDDKAVISVAVYGTPGKRANLFIPAPAPDIFMGNGAFGPESETVDPSDAALMEFLQLFVATEVNSDTDPTGVFLFSDGEQVDDVPAAKGRKI